MGKECIELTPQELEDVKDEVKFRTTVMIDLKRLRIIPDKVNKLSIHSNIQWFLLSTIILGLMGVLVRGLSK